MRHVIKSMVAVGAVWSSFAMADLILEESTIVEFKGKVAGEIYNALGVQPDRSLSTRSRTVKKFQSSDNRLSIQCDREAVDRNTVRTECRVNLLEQQP